MTIAPQVELLFSPTDLRPQDLPRTGAFLGTPAEALESALAVARAQVIDQTRKEIRGLAAPTYNQLLTISDLAWQAAFWNFRRLSAPVLADAYIRAYRKADAGDVPMHVIYNLADKHAEKIGEYFHASSREALGEGFNSYVNRRLPARAAAERVLDAYGLTPRQMRSYTATAWDTPVNTSLPRALKARARAFIDKSFTTRIKKMSAQEEHNIEQQAQQYAWMWLQDKDRLSEKAEKVWITAHDERVCAVCGPLHNQRVPVNERFKTAQGEFWTPGLHPNCRCEVRLLEHRFSKDLTGSALLDFNRVHTRDDHGRFSAKARTRQPKVETLSVEEEFAGLISSQKHQAPPKAKLVRAPKEDLKTKTEFEELIGAQAPVEADPFTSQFVSTTPVADLSRAEVWAAVEDVAAMVAPPEMKTEFVNDTKVALDMRALTQTEVTPATRTKPPAVNLETIAYAVVGPEQFHQVEGGADITKIELNEGITFVNSKEYAANTAAEMIQRDVDRAVDNILVQQHGSWSQHDTKMGDVSARMTPEAVAEAVAWHAASATQHLHDPDFMGIGRAPVNYYDGEGNFMGGKQVRYDEIGRRFNISPSDFEVYIVEVDQGHNQELSDLGTTEYVGGSYDDGEAVFELTGEFEKVGDVERVPGWAIEHEGGATAWNASVIKIEPAGRHEEGE